MLSGVQVEDSAKIECAAGKSSSRKASQVLAVCGQYLMLNRLLMNDSVSVIQYNTNVLLQLCDCFNIGVAMAQDIQHWMLGRDDPREPNLHRRNLPVLHFLD